LPVDIIGMLTCMPFPVLSAVVVVLVMVVIFLQLGLQTCAGQQQVMQAASVAASAQRCSLEACKK
jgi:uncharacterized membrane protein